MTEHSLPTLPPHDIQVVYPVREILPEDGYTCPVCDEPMVAGADIARAIVGPGSDLKEREAARVGTGYTPLFMLMHYGCATGDVGDPAVSKHLWMDALLARGLTAVVLSEAAAGVELPVDFPWKAGVGVLNFSFNFRNADLLVSEDGIFQTLSFGGNPHPCFVPWKAVRAFRQEQPYKVVVLYADAPEAAPKEREDLVEEDEPAIIPVPWAPHLGVVKN